MANETEEFNRETLEQRIDRLEKKLIALENRSRFNQVAVVNAIDRINPDALERGKRDAKLITGWEETPQK